MTTLSVEDGSLQKAIEERARAETEYLKKHTDCTIISYIPTEGGFNNLKERIVELEVQIERMKCCGNCDWSNYLPNGNCLDCDGKKNWKLKEIKENA